MNETSLRDRAPDHILAGVGHQLRGDFPNFLFPEIIFDYPNVT